MHEKVVSLGSRLHYPITITKLMKAPGDSIKKQDHIIEYKFSWRRQVGDNNNWADETTYTEFDSPAEGTLKEWRIREGMVISADVPCMVVEEACGHEVQIQGLCSLCGADMTEVNWASEEKDTDRAMINMTHDQTGLMVSQGVAQKAEHDTQRRLLRQRKLSLVVDLDQTIIHACIEPTIGEWQRDPSNPNYEAVKDVVSFQLKDDGPRGLASGCTYYIKLRPGLREFLDEVSKMYELHVYTMGTRAYALNIARIVDPEQKLFGNRVISRDENGSITAKSLQRLFPVSTNMVVIIDDRSDVWPGNRPNLIKVVPYDFFKGIGDINSSFLPKRVDLSPAPTASTTVTATTVAAPVVSPDSSTAGTEAKAASSTTETTNNVSKLSPFDDIARMSSGSDQESLRMQAEEQEKTLEKQLTDRPLLHMQEELDKADEQSDDNQDVGKQSQNHHRQHLLNDNDEELMALQDHLTDLHTAFYETYDRKRKERRKSEPKHQPGANRMRRRSSVDDGVDLSMVPDVGDILDELKSNVLSGLVIVLSGLVPLGGRVEQTEIGMQALSFGAQMLDSLSRRVTHVVVSTSRPRTKKVQQAAKMSGIKIVTQNWLVDCLSQWRRLDEGPYFLEISNMDREKPDRDASQNATPEPEVDESEARNLKDFDWAKADEDLAEFLDDGEDDDDDGDEEEEADDNDDSDDDDSDDSDYESDDDSQEAEDVSSDSENSRLNADDERGLGSSRIGGSKRRVKRKKPADGDEPNAEEPASGSTLAKKQRLSRTRGANSLRAMRPSPPASSAAEAPSASQDSKAAFNDELERELLAELEAAEGN